MDQTQARRLDRLGLVAGAVVKRVVALTAVAAIAWLAFTGVVGGLVLASRETSPTPTTPTVTISTVLPPPTISTTDYEVTWTILTKAGKTLTLTYGGRQDQANALEALLVPQIGKVLVPSQRVGAILKSVSPVKAVPITVSGP